ncbi:MAG: PQQ-dependent sugar dehydrogenase, partial [Planctomycetales bacterium]|nr:PQQ-dependent sugar dehydrogenase [Planctomycetales bacterium]
SETLTNQVPGGKMSSLRRAGDLLFATGQGTSMSIFEIADAGLSQIAELDMRYSGSWLHPHSALAVQHNGENYSLYFQLGSDRNFDTTTRTVTLNADFGLTAELAGDALHRLDFVYSNQDGFSNSSVTQIATGLRNAAGMAFHPLTGDLYLEDNGIDGVQNPNEPTSADEINVIPLGTDSIVDFGFPHSYVEYRTGNLIGNADLAPLVAFLPLPNPADGAEAEGPNDISFGPANFPLPLHSGLFVGMHGKFSLGGTSNEENPLVFVDLRDNSYSHVIANTEPNVGHLDGILATDNALYLADISPSGGFSAGANRSGIIYRIESLYPSIDEISIAIQQGSSDPHFDLDQNGEVNQADQTMLIRQIHDTHLGDANMDGIFNSSDLVQVFQAGLYETDALATWAQGDWNGDQRFGSGDLVAAFQDGAYTDAAIQTVPEPASGGLASIIVLAALVRRRCSRRR